jgi:hypothetical protein
MSDVDREREKALREAAIAGAGALAVPGSGRPLEPREIKQMLSVRLEPELISQLRDLATKRGQSISDVIREALVQLVTEASMSRVMFSNFELKGVDYGRTTSGARKVA